MQDIDGMIDFFLYEKGESILINGAEQVALVIDAVNKITYYNDKLIRCKCLVKTGDLVQYGDANYLIISQIDKSEKTYKARIRKCSYSIAFNWSGNIKWFDCVEESKVFDVSSGQYISLPTGSINITVQNNGDTRDIVLSQRFYVTNQPFKVTGIDKSQEGLIMLNCALDFINTEYDDVENNIADRWRYEITHTYVLAIGNGAGMSVPINDLAQLNITVTDNGTTMNPLSALTFLSSDSTIVSVDNTGKMMGINPGTATITCQMTYKSLVKATISITAVEIINHVYTIAITGSTSVKMGLNQSYVAHFYDNGNEVFDKSATWSLRNQDGTTTLYATLTASTGNGATVKGVTMNKNVILKAVLSDNSTVFNEFVILVKGII